MPNDEVLIEKYWEIEKKCSDTSETSIYKTDGGLYVGLRAMQSKIIGLLSETAGITRDEVVAKLRKERKRLK